MTAALTSLRRILVPVDLTPAARSTLEYALSLGQHLEAVVDAQHVWHTSTEIAVTAARDQAKQSLRDFTADIEIPARCQLRRRTDHGDPYLTILQCAQLSAYDLLVVRPPLPGRGTAQHVALSLLNTLPIPLLVVPQGFVAAGNADGSARIARVTLVAPEVERASAPLQAAGAVAAACEAELEVLCRASDEAALRARLPGGAAAPVRLTPVGDVEAALYERARPGGADLCVAGVAISPLGGLSRDRAAERLFLRCERPLLFVPIKTAPRSG